MSGSPVVKVNSDIERMVDAYVKAFQPVAAAMSDVADDLRRMFQHPTAWQEGECYWPRGLREAIRNYRQEANR